MKSLDKGYGYNQRLFSGGLRSKLHYARFRWFNKQLLSRQCPAESILELGCFDGKLIDFLPAMPSRYLGFDANWEGGLDLAKEKYKDSSAFLFVEASSAEQMQLKIGNVFDVAVAMETLEHVPPALVDEYLRKISEHLEGYFFVTVPNEKGLVFLLKWLAKKMLRMDAQEYTLSELKNATLGRMQLVSRNEHKGFDYDALVERMKKYFDVLEVSGHPFGFLPCSWCFGVGIVAVSRNRPPKG